ncbi:MAG: PEP-CTERM sorting domain-containing protein [Botrimarina sp.]
MLLAPGAADALVIKSFDPYEPGQVNPNPDLINTDPPGNGLDFANLATNRSGIYLGDHWFLTAWHAQPGGSTPTGNVQLAGSSFPVIAQSAVRIANSGGGLDASSDLLMYRIGLDAAGNSPEDLDSGIQSIVIADQLASTGTTLTMFGRGAARRQNEDNTQTGTYQFSSSGAILESGTGAYEGFLTSSSGNVWQWGENRRYGGTRTFSAGPLVNDTRGFVVRFDEFGLEHEAQAASGDSGGPVFWQDGGQWVLAGLHHVVFSASSTSSSVNLQTAFNAQTGISDLSNSFYRSQIQGLRDQTEYSLLGDIDLDGAVTGEIVGGVATGDLAAMAANWMHSAPEGDLKTWVRGDINQDGITDLDDFVLLRDALGGAIETADFAAVVSAYSAATPEPSAAALLLTAAAAAAARRRR